MRSLLRRTAVGAVGLLALTVQACTQDAVAPTSPLKSGVVFTEVPGTGTGVVLEATKTVEPHSSESATYDWEIAKSVTPAHLVLGTGESGAFNFVITATRTQTSSSGSYGMTGKICVKNTGTEATSNLRVTDRLYESVGGVATELEFEEIDVSGNPVLDPGESHCYSYAIQMDADFTPNPEATYYNGGFVYSTVTDDAGVSVSKRLAKTTVDLDWADATDPLNAEDASARVVDVVDCPAGFTCTPSGAEWNFDATTTQPFSVIVKNVNAVCGTEFQVVNAATLTELDSEVVRGPATAAGLIATQECAPPPSIHGCTPGYWKQKHHFDSWTGFTQNQDYDAVFGVDAFSPNRTLLQALSSGGGKMDRLGRHSVAALLNTSNGEVEYGMSTADVIAMVQQAVASGNYDWAADQLEALNERGCPLN